MKPWGELPEIAYDATLGTAAQRRIARTAADTLFPTLLPEVTRIASAPAPAQLPGQGTLDEED